MSLPLMATAWVLKILYSLINSNFEPVVVAFSTAMRDQWTFLEWITVRVVRNGESAYTIPFAGFIMTVAFLVALGAFVSHVVGKACIQWFEKFIGRIPLASNIYFAAKQVVESVQKVGGSGAPQFNRVVLVKYPNLEMKTLAFVTGSFRDKNNITICSVFIPTAPNPITGFVFLMPESELESSDLSIEEATKFIVSAGIVCPTNLRFYRPQTGGQT